MSDKIEPVVVQRQRDETGLSAVTEHPQVDKAMLLAIPSFPSTSTSQSVDSQVGDLVLKYCEIQRPNVDLSTISGNKPNLGIEIPLDSLINDTWKEQAILNDDKNVRGSNSSSTLHTPVINMDDDYEPFAYPLPPLDIDNMLADIPEKDGSQPNTRLSDVRRPTTSVLNRGQRYENIPPEIVGTRRKTLKWYFVHYLFGNDEEAHEAFKTTIRPEDRIETADYKMMARIIMKHFLHFPFILIVLLFLFAYYPCSLSHILVLLVAIVMAIAFNIYQNI